MSTPTLRVAVTQAEPIWFDLQATLQKTLALVVEAAAGGAKLISFPELWLPGYPGWIWARVFDPVLNTRYIQNSLQTDSTEMQQLQKAAKHHSICIVLGFSERTHSNSLYIAQAIISPQGAMVVKRRKLKPTHMERTIFGDGTGTDLSNVAPIDFGAPVGTLNIGTLACWEHTQPLLKYHTYAQNEAIHIAMWPPLARHPGPDAPALYSMTHDGAFSLSTAYAIEGGAFVLYTTCVLGDKGVETFGTKEGLVFQEPGGGHAAIVGPDGRKVSVDLEGGETVEGLLFGELELGRGVANRAFLDVVGHYSRPDLLWLGVDREEKKGVVVRDGVQGVKS